MQVAILSAGQSGLLKDLEVADVPECLGAYIELLKGKHPDAMHEIAATKVFSGEAQDVLRESLEDFLRARQSANS